MSVGRLFGDGPQWVVDAVVDPDEEARLGAAAEFNVLGFRTATELPQAGPGDVAVIAFSSSVEPTVDAIVDVLERGYHAVTTCEDLAFAPSAVADRLEDLAVQRHRVIAVTGANPGFVMDRLPIACAHASWAVRRITVTRRLDTKYRRAPLVRKTGKGLTEAAFREGVASGDIGHRGLIQSAKAVTLAMGWPDGHEEVTIDPVIDDHGLVAGLAQVARVDTGGRVVELSLVMAWGVENPSDTVEISGEPEFRLEIPGGFHGDTGTAALVANSVVMAPRLEPGYYDPGRLPLAVPPQRELPNP
jgi:4-hydroxy-tetrahydrodipicolinate reductase